MRDGFLCMAACISSDDGREAWARAICRCERAGLQAAAPVVFFWVFFLTSNCSIAYIVEGKRVFSAPSICTALVTLAAGIGSDAAAEWIARAINR